MFSLSSFLLVTVIAKDVLCAEWCLFSGNKSRILEKYGSNEENIVKRNIDFTYALWPYGKIPYYINTDSFTNGSGDPAKAKAEVEKLVSDAIEEFHKKTCVRFVPRTDEEIYVEFLKEDEECGYVYSWGNNLERHRVFLNRDWCFALGIVLHELGHVIGLEHEHTRPDRDDYLIVNYENIKEEEIEAFRKMSCSAVILFNLFDFDSIMLYDEYQGSKSKELKAIEARSGKRIIGAEFKKEISKSDAENINMAYACLDYIDLS